MPGSDTLHPVLDVEHCRVDQPEELGEAIREHGLGLVALRSITPDEMLRVAGAIGEIRPETDTRRAEDVIGGCVLRITTRGNGVCTPHALGLHVDDQLSAPYDMPVSISAGPSWLRMGMPYALAIGCERPPEPGEGGTTLIFDSSICIKNSTLTH